MFNFLFKWVNGRWVVDEYGNPGILYTLLGRHYVMLYYKWNDDACFYRVTMPQDDDDIFSSYPSSKYPNEKPENFRIAQKRELMLGYRDFHQPD